MSTKKNPRGPGFVTRFVFKGKEYERAFPTEEQGKTFEADTRKAEGAYQVPDARSSYDYWDARNQLNAYDPKMTLATAISRFIEKAQKVKVEKRIEMAVQEFLANKKPNSSRRQYNNLRGRVSPLRDEFRGKLVSEIHPEAVRLWVMKRYKDPVTIRKWLSDIGNFFNFSMRQGWCEEFIVNRDMLPKIKRKPVEILGIDDTKVMLLDILNGPMKRRGFFPHFFIQAFAGIRQEEMTKFDWSYIDFIDKRIHLPEIGVDGERVNKTDDAWLINDFEEGFFDVLAFFKADGWVPCPAQVTSSRMRNEWVLKGLVKGVPYRRKAINGKKPPMMVFPQNGLRHSFATYSVALHKDAKKVAQLTRHSNQETLKAKYLKVQFRPETGRAYFKIILDILEILKKEKPATD